MELQLKGKRVVVTGGSGFLGRHVVAELRKHGADNIVQPRSKELDLREMSACTKICEGADVLVHLAAHVGGIGLNQQKPGELFYDNAIMGIQLIEAARRQGIEKTVVVGTICAYPKFTPVPFREENLWDGYPEETNAPYGVAKKALLVQLQSYRAQYGMNGVFLLPVNLYGPYDNFDLNSSHVIPALIRKFVEAKNTKSKTVTLWGDGSPSREFLYVDDCARGIVAATLRYNGGEPVNLGNGREIRIKELSEIIRELIYPNCEIRWDTTKPNGQPRRCLDVSRAEKLFGFKAQTSFEEGLRRTIEWYSSTLS